MNLLFSMEQMSAVRPERQQDIELDQKTETLDEIEKKRVRDAIVDGSQSVRDRLSKLYSKSAD